MLFRMYTVWEDCLQNCCDWLFLLSELWPIHNVSGDTALYVHRYFPSRAHIVYPNALVLGLGLHGANKNLVVRGICPQFGWEATWVVSWSYFIDQKTACVYVLYNICWASLSSTLLKSSRCSLTTHQWLFDLKKKNKRKEKANTRNSKIYRINLSEIEANLL